jgi:hypothetical protein
MKVDIGNRRGMTEYIDFLNINDFIIHNQMNSDTDSGHEYNVTNKKASCIYGDDIYNRFFISILYQDEDDKVGIMTIFQRYTDDLYYFVSCGNTFFFHSDVHTANFNNELHNLDDQFIYFFNLINNSITTITKNIYNSDITKKFRLYDNEQK